MKAFIHGYLGTVVSTCKYYPGNNTSKLFQHFQVGNAQLSFIVTSLLQASEPAGCLRSGGNMQLLKKPVSKILFILAENIFKNVEIDVLGERSPKLLKF